jgi:hypothetical protein
VSGSMLYRRVAFIMSQQNKTRFTVVICILASALFLRACYDIALLAISDYLYYVKDNYVNVWITCL